MNELSPGEGPVVLALGPRAAEEALLRALCALDREAISDPARLAQPVRVVVPSGSLREHVAARLVARVGRPVAGFAIQTLHGLALELLDRAGEAPRRADVLFPVLVRRAARGEPELRSALDGLEDGYGAVVAATADLADAGFDASIPAHVDAVEEALAEAGLPAAARARAHAVVAAAAGTARTMAGFGVGRPGARLARAAALLDWVGLAGRAQEKAGALAYGEQRLVGVALALATEPAMLLLDEPVSGMNASETRVFVRLIRQIRERGVTILLVEHDMPMVMEVSDRIVVLNYGRLIAEGPPDRIRSDPAVIEAYLGQGSAARQAAAAAAQEAVHA